MILQTLTSSEEEIMQLIWQKEKIYFRELMEIFPEPKPHQNTVSTFLKILVEKHYLTTEKEGRIYLYSPSIGFDDYKKFVLKRFLENYFDNSGTELLKVLMEEKFIKLKDLNQFFEGKITNMPLTETIEKDNHIQDFIKEITGDKKLKKKDKKNKKKKK
ncbi:BlaI/MecI/CopY family transcriptional regulator [Epilithonimonas sp. UC225_85]|uniref:BlaI/MecI/CopY family transcriptional regulator n=1 Tax=Epilithonimonas sp. UC225_85 TaxID=3350167 RepID=UPI0036D2CDE5